MLIVKYLPISFKFSNSILDWTSLQWNFGEIFLKTFLEGSVDRVIYRDYIVSRRFFIYCSLACSSAGSASHGGDVTVYVFDINPPSLPTPFNSVLMSVSVFMALSTVFHSIYSFDNFPLSHSVLPVLFLPYWSFQLLYLFMKVSLSSDVILCG